MITRRSFLRSTVGIFAPLSVGSFLGSSYGSTSTTGRISNIGPLSPPDQNGLMLPRGFTSRIIARSGIAPHAGSPYLWHAAPDGGATFPTMEGGWIYVSNSELSRNRGGVGAIRFDALGKVIQAYPILENTNGNCAGGATPWDTWLSCEEVENGIVWECDPHGLSPAIPLLALGTFAHEAVTVDTQTNHLYLTEDKPDGLFYRFVPASLNSQGFPDLSAGSLEAAVVDWSTSKVKWVKIPIPDASDRPTRYQLSSSTKFNGGEGIVFYGGVVSFATKGDNRIWSYDTRTDRIFVIYDASTHPTPILTGVDNITLSKSGELIVGEDGGNMQIVAITKSRQLIPLVQLVGHDSSEVTGPAFSPDGRRLYFSSQRGTRGTSKGGMTFEVLGPFHT
jgi:hypothetical protein